MIMGRKEAQTGDPSEKEMKNSISDSITIKGASAAAKLVKDD